MLDMEIDSQGFIRHKSFVVFIGKADPSADVWSDVWPWQVGMESVLNLIVLREEQRAQTVFC